MNKALRFVLAAVIGMVINVACESNQGDASNIARTASTASLEDSPSSPHESAAAVTPSLQVIGNDPNVGPICSGPLGPGPCAAIAHYLAMQRSGIPPNAGFDPLQPIQVINRNQPTVGPLCRGPQGPTPCSIVQQLKLDHSDSSVPPTAEFNIPAGLSASQLGAECARRSGLDVTIFVGCTDRKIILRSNEQKVLDCAISTPSAHKFADCAAGPLGISLSQEQYALASCAWKSRGEEISFAPCWNFGPTNADQTGIQAAVLQCAKSADDDPDKFSVCASPYILGKGATLGSRIALRCAVQAQGDSIGYATCAGANLFNSQVSPEQQIALQCVVSTGGQPGAATGCMATRMTARELLKCVANGIGGTDGCFGTGNDPEKGGDWSARSLTQIITRPDSFVKNPSQIWGGDNSFVENPSQILGGNNAFVRNPSQIWGGNNSIFNNPGKLIPQTSDLATEHKKRICVPWCDTETAATPDPTPQPTAPPPSTSQPQKNYAVERVFFGTDREIVKGAHADEVFNATRSKLLSYGEVDVSIPLDHHIGELESPSIWKLEFRPEPDKHVAVLRTATLVRETFLSKLKDGIAKSSKKSVLLFVHGFNVSFADAARRTAQMAHDVGFKGVPVFFSWPSQDRLLSYTVDEQSIIDSEPHLERFLREMLLATDAENIYLIAHSIGTRGLTRALIALGQTDPKSIGRIKEVILAAPDIGTTEFTEQIAPSLRKLGAPITLYASSNDRALSLSMQLHGGARAGESGDHIVVFNGIETIDASNTDTDLVGHSYYGDRRSVIADMSYLVNEDLSAGKRVISTAC